MNPPSKKWIQTRNAAIESAHRRVFEPLKKRLADCITAAVAVFLISYIRFNFFDFPAVETSTNTAVQVAIAGIAMVSLPILLIASVPIILLDLRFRREVHTARENA